jgi:hypothetical protein
MGKHAWQPKASGCIPARRPASPCPAVRFPLAKPAITKSRISGSGWFAGTAAEDAKVAAPKHEAGRGKGHQRPPKALGLTIPQSLLQRANQVIE